MSHDTSPHAHHGAPAEQQGQQEAPAGQERLHWAVWSVFARPDGAAGTTGEGAGEFDAAVEQLAGEGVTLRGVVTCIRHFGPDKAKRAALCAAETAGDWLVGFGMAGDEKQGKQRDFAYSFDMAREAGLRLTSHAGEWNGPQEVREAVEDLRVERIGHGVRAAPDLAVVDMLAERGITLEVCPGSNVFLGVYPALRAHPVDMLRKRGVKVTVSTDDPPFFHTSMRQEYLGLARAFGWDEEIFAEINRTALDAAFCDAATKEAVLKKLEQA